MESLAEANGILRNCDSEYTLKLIQNPVPLESDCHTGILEKGKNEYTIGVYTGTKLVSYLSFNVYPKVIHIMYSCTKIDYRRKKLNLILRLLLIEVAYRLKVKYIVSYTNNASGGLLEQFNARKLKTPFPEEINKLIDYLGVISKESIHGGINSIIELNDPETKKMVGDLRNSFDQCKIK